ncbi:type I DNA topoisomerase [Curvivirga sp.]|uniref:type I DNA topoisomerase n=1 Tax=Curvivirga sp. TaxID=2856848 RepID=UPI003B5A1334
MAAENVLIVESPAKAKTINKYLGSDFTVLASFGHVRDLPSKDGSVDPDNDFAMQWQVDSSSKKRLDDIAKACKSAKNLMLATDPDREGEAISWHLQEELARRKVLKDLNVSRVVFNEITKNAIVTAIDQARELDQDLIDAYMARRALDYLVGFSISPVLWRKLPGSRSAGRVQSVALRLICDREAEIEAFRPDEYWSVAAKLSAPNGQAFEARLTHFDGEKLDKLSLGNQGIAEAALNAVKAGQYTISETENKTVRRNPYAPFTTSTLQQEASRKLGFGATKTMTLAQRLYEGTDIGGETVGLITYMRTDSTTLSMEAINSSRNLIQKEFGENYLPNSPRIYKTKAKNAQEAHEAVRPTDLSRHPKQMAAYLDNDQLRLYELIWKRTMASQMESAVFDQMKVVIPSSDGRVTLRATGSVLKFDGFLTLYTESKDDDPSDDDENSKRLPPMEKGDATPLNDASAEQHFTQPPPRFTEASLVKKLEELGIGRPSTYASILKLLQDRDYVTLDKRRFQPQERGRLVTSFLTAFFERYVDYGFTAALEEKLDDISDGQKEWKAVLREFWGPFHGQTETALALTYAEVREAMDKELAVHFFKQDEDGSTEAARKCPSCGTGRMGLNIGKYGPYLSCSNYPECKYNKNLSMASNDDGEEGEVVELPKELGVDPESGQVVSLKQGPYGVYVQLGEAEKKGDKPKRASLLKTMKPSGMDLDLALRLLSLPRDLGTHPDSGALVQAGVGRYGPYLKHGTAFVSLPKEDDILTIGMNRAVEVIAQAGDKGKANAKRELGVHPEDGKAIHQGIGRFGPYVQHGRTYASISKSSGIDPEEITLEQALELIAAKLAKGPSKKGASKKAAAKKAKSKKVSSKKASAKKASKKSAAKKSAAKKAAAKKAS